MPANKQINKILSEKLLIDENTIDILITITFDKISKLMKKEKKITISKFGKFTIKKIKSYQTINPRTLEKITIKEFNKIYFKQSKKISCDNVS